MISEQIEAILAAFDQIQKDNQWCYEEVGKLDKQTQDLLHEFELERLSQNDRARLGTKLSRIRRERRKNKDFVQQSDPLVSFLTSDRGKQMINMLRETLGKTRKVQKTHETRTYKKKVEG